MKLLISILAVTILVFGVTTSLRADLNDGVIAAWTFDDGKVTDAVGKAHGELFKAAKIVGNGKFGKALDVDGSDETRADIEFNDDLEAAIEEPHTVSMWLYVRNGANHAGVWKGEKIGWGAHFTFRLVTTNNTTMTFGTTTGGAQNYFHAENCIELEKWYHVCQVADGKQAFAYVTADGDKLTLPPSARNNPHPAPTLYNLFPDRPLELGAGRGIGGNDGNDMFLDALIDDVIIWNRALSEDEVADLASGARPNKALAVKAEGKLTTIWGKVKSYHHR